MKLNRFFHQRSGRAKQVISKSAAASRPSLEPLEARQLMSVTLDIRAASGGKTATVTSVGQVVDLDIYAVVSGSTSGSNDAVLSATGSLLSTESNTSTSLVGNLSVSIDANDYGAQGASDGTQQDLNGDGGLDVGSNDNGDVTGFINARAGGENFDGTVSGDTATFLLGTATYTVTKLSDGQSTGVNFRYRDGIPAGAFDAVWVQDGNGENDQIGTALVGSAVTITDPNLSVPPSTGSISGTVSKSVSGSVSGFASQTVYLDNNKDGVLDSGDTSTTTSSTGAYSFSGLTAGTYYVREVVPTGYSQTSPSSSPTTVVLSAGQNVTGDNFVDTASTTAPATGSIAGTVSQVVNGSTSTFTSVTVYLDANNNSLLDSGELSTVTNGSGAYSFSGVPAGAYTIRQVLPGSYTQTSPSSNAGISVTVASGSNFTSENFTDTASAVTTPTGTKLSGTAIGTSGSYENDGNTIAKALDGNLSTFFDGPSANGNTVGLDLGSGYVITSIAYASRSGWASRMNGGVFQASNSSTFTSGVVNLYTVAANASPSSTSLTTQTINNSTAYRYVRYVGPNGSYGNVSEVQFFGTASTVTNPTQPTATPLTGTAIGTSGSYENDGNTIAKALDGNLSTFFDGPSANGNTVGLDLGSGYVITSIAYASRSGWASRMNGGVFQGSNSSTFTTGVVNLYTIASNANPSSTSLTTQTISNSTAFRYVRYVGPSGSYGNVSEVQFFGTASTATTPTLTQFTGTTIGTSGSYQNDGNTIAKATDGNLSTFFDGVAANGQWVGLNLGTAKIVQEISFAPRSGFTSRMVGGIFQASDTADFSSGVVNLYTVTTAPTAGVLTSLAVNVTTAYQYYRYLSPNGSEGDIAEVEFFG